MKLMKCIQIFKDGKMDEIDIQNIKNLKDVNLLIKVLII